MAEENKAPEATVKTDKLDKGPKMGQANDYLPSTYKLQSGNVRKDN